MMREFLNSLIFVLYYNVIKTKVKWNINSILVTSLRFMTESIEYQILDEVGYHFKFMNIEYIKWFKKEMKKKWVYYGVFFSDVTKKAILNYVKNWFAKNNKEFPIKWTKYCDHMTLVFNNGTEAVQKFADTVEPFLGEKISLNIVSVGISNRAIAVGVDYTTNNEHSHVTVAVAPGAKPVESNDIVNWIPTNEYFYVTGTYKKV